MLFCSVNRGRHTDHHAGYVPAYETEPTAFVCAFGHRHLRRLGLGAGMAVRREFAAFDSRRLRRVFRPRGALSSAYEWGHVDPILCWQVDTCSKTPDIAIVHDGFRNLRKWARHARRDWIALGAVSLKPLARLSASRVLPLGCFRHARPGRPSRICLRLRRPARRRAAFVSFLQGFAPGVWRTGLDGKGARVVCDEAAAKKT